MKWMRPGRIMRALGALFRRRPEGQRRDDAAREAWHEARKQELAEIEAADVRRHLSEIAGALGIPDALFFAAILRATNTLAEDLDRSWLWNWVCFDGNFVYGVHGGIAPVEAYRHVDLDTVIRELAVQRGIHPKALSFDDAIAERRIRVRAFNERYAGISRYSWAGSSQHLVHGQVSVSRVGAGGFVRVGREAAAILKDNSSWKIIG